MTGRPNNNLLKLTVCLLSTLLSGCFSQDTSLHRYDVTRTDNKALQLPPGLRMKTGHDYEVPVIKKPANARTELLKPQAKPILDPPTTKAVISRVEAEAPYNHYHTDLNLIALAQLLPEAIKATDYHLLQTSLSLHTFYISQPHPERPQDTLLQIQSDKAKQNSGSDIIVLNNDNQPVSLANIQPIIDYIESHSDEFTH